MANKWRGVPTAERPLVLEVVVGAVAMSPQLFKSVAGTNGNVMPGLHEAILYKVVVSLGNFDAEVLEKALG